MFIDVHCHLDMVEKEKDIDSVIKNAKKKNVLIVTNGVNPESNRKTLGYMNENVKLCLGVYPEHVDEMKDKEIDEEIEFIKKNKEKIVGIGEVGMDFVSGESKRQEKYFRRFISLSQELDMPITVHSRKAEGSCIEILEEMKAKKVIMHCFSGNMKLVQKIIDNGWFLSIPTSVKNSHHFQKVIEICPIEQLLCETDSPYLHPDKEFPNEPANVVESYEMITKIKKMKLNEVEKKIEKNFKRFF